MNIDINKLQNKTLYSDWEFYIYGFSCDSNLLNNIQNHLSNQIVPTYVLYQPMIQLDDRFLILQNF